jgi:hypothetical protein
VIASFWRGEISVRKLRALVEHLPPGGAFYRATQGHGWTEVEALLADLFDAVNGVAAAVYRSAPGRKRKHIANPKPHPRPGRERELHIGDIGDHDPETVVVYLRSLSPKGA